MKTVRMRHPKLGRERDFPEQSAKHHVRAGWREVTQPEPVPQPALASEESTSEPEPTTYFNVESTASEKPSRKRRRSESEES